MSCTFPPLVPRDHTTGQTAAAGPDDLRRVFRRHAAGVCVVTASHLGAPVGLLVTSLASVSATPPLISFNVSRGSSSWPALREVEHIGLHLLGAGQQNLADLFARRGADRFGVPTAWRPGPRDVPLLEGVTARSVARVEQRVPVADHVIVVARLLHADVDESVSPLLHHDGNYHRVTPVVQEQRAGG